MSFSGDTLLVPVIMYHHIRTAESTDSALLKDLSLDLQAFKQHLDYLEKRHYRAVTFYELASLVGKQELPSENIVILTFDDGYDDNWEAFDELIKRNMKAVFFITVASIDKKHHLSRQQLRELSNSGMEIGSHTQSHVDLTSSNSARLTKEIVGSKQRLEAIIGKEVISFCYPSGRYNDNVVKNVKNAGYKWARTTNPGINEISINNYVNKPDNNYRLKILRVHNYTKLEALNIL